MGPMEAKVEEAEVDRALESRSSVMRKTLEAGKAIRVEDMPTDVWDAGYMEEKGIHHMSFHAYLRKLADKRKSSGVRGSFFLLEDEVDALADKVKKMDGQVVKLKDMPSAMILARQPFRMVDYVQFESPAMFDAFLGGWRESGNQRFGWLYGRYQVHEETPLGIAAVVCAIYEPPQTGYPDGLQLTLPDPDEATVDEVAARLGLERVGMVFTDLVDDGTGTGKVRCKRHANSFFVSSLECMFAADVQCQYPCVSKHSASGRFGSRMVSVVVSGDADHNVAPSAFQVSNQCMAMQKAGIIEASTNPALMRIVNPAATGSKQFVPDVIFKQKNEYGTEVTQSAKPTFPVEYLLVDVSCGFPKDVRPMFAAPVGGSAFPVENRDRGAAARQDWPTVHRHLGVSDQRAALADFHLLIFLAKSGLWDMKDDFPALCAFARAAAAAATGSAGAADGDAPSADELLVRVMESNSWQTMQSLLADGGGSLGSQAQTSGGGGNDGGGGAPSDADLAKYAAQLAQLAEMGFTDQARMVRLLNQHQGVVDLVLTDLF